MLQIETARWIYLAIYIAAPIGLIFYLTRVFGLKNQEDALSMANHSLDQAEYWTNIAMNDAQFTLSKSFSSLAHTIQRNLEQADEALSLAAGAPPAKIAPLCRRQKRIEAQFRSACELADYPMKEIAIQHS